MGYWLAKKLRTTLEFLIHLLSPNAILDSSDFPWHQEVEAATSDIIKELNEVLCHLDDVHNFNDILPNQRALKQNDQWKSYFLKVLGVDVPKHVQACPKTQAVIEKIPHTINAFFSILRPGVEIPPHRGPYAGILRYHLGLIIPKGDVGIKVNGTLCKWEVGKSLFFDDSFSHEAWNKTDQIRVILFVDFKRPLNPLLKPLNDLILMTFKHSRVAKNGKTLVLNT